MILGFISALAVLLIDMLTKHYLYGIPARSILGNFLWIEPKFNDGIAFSMFEGKSYIFAIIGLVACVGIAWLIISKSIFDTKLAKLGLGLVMGGTLGNVLDRLTLGGVRDFLSLRFIHFPVFNVADLAIVVGVILICIFVIVVGNKKGKEKSEKTEQDTQGSEKVND